VHPETVAFWFEAANEHMLSGNRLTSLKLLSYYYTYTYICANRPHIINITHIIVIHIISSQQATHIYTYLLFCAIRTYYINLPLSNKKKIK